jgi:hypothetical protein
MTLARTRKMTMKVWKMMRITSLIIGEKNIFEDQLKLTQNFISIADTEPPPTMTRKKIFTTRRKKARVKKPLKRVLTMITTFTKT